MMGLLYQVFMLASVGHGLWFNRIIIVLNKKVYPGFVIFYPPILADSAQVSQASWFSGVVVEEMTVGTPPSGRMSPLIVSRSLHWHAFFIDLTPQLSTDMAET